MFRETLFFKTALYSAYDWLAKIRQPIFCRAPSALQLLSVSAFQNRSRGKSCVVERGASGSNPLSRLRRQLSRRESPWQKGQVSSLFVNGRKKSAVKLQTFRPCQSLSLSGEVARRSRDGEGLLPGRTLSVAYGDSSPEGRALGKEGKFRPHRSTAGRSLPLSCKLFVLAKASPFRERWHGEAVTERVASGTNPLSLAALDSSPEGRALGKEGRSRPYSSTAGRSLPLSRKLFASAKASPERERWHGEAVTERVCSPSQIFFKIFYFPCRRQAPCFVLEYRGERKAPAKRAWRASAPNRTERRPCRHDEPGIRRNGASISEPGLHGLPPAGTG